MNFLKYIERSAENLQFFLWVRDYSRRFEELPQSEKALSPEWTGEKSANEAGASRSYGRPEAAAIFKGTAFANDTEAEKTSSPFLTPPRTPGSEGERDGGESFDTFDHSLATSRLDHSQRASGAFEGAGLKWKPREC